MTTKLATKFFAAASSHREMPEKFVACYGMPGEPTRWVMRGQYLDTFDTKEQAELAAHKVIMAKLNSAMDVQEFHVRPSSNKLPKVYRAPTGRQLSTEAEKVFGGIGKK